MQKTPSQQESNYMEKSQYQRWVRSCNFYKLPQEGNSYTQPVSCKITPPSSSSLFQSLDKNVSFPLICRIKVELRSWGDMARWGEADLLNSSSGLAWVCEWAEGDDDSCSGFRLLEKAWRCLTSRRTTRTCSSVGLNGSWKGKLSQSAARSHTMSNQLQALTSSRPQYIPVRKQPISHQRALFLIHGGQRSHRPRLLAER